MIPLPAANAAAWTPAALPALRPVAQIPPSPDVSAVVPFSGPEVVLGSPDAPIEVVEYLSVTCSHCAAFDRDTWPQVERGLVATGRVRFVIREAPTAPVAVAEAGFLLARCAGEARYWPTVRALLAKQSQVLASGTLAEAIGAEAAVAGLEPLAVRTCLSDETAIAAGNSRRLQALDAGVDSTPYFIVNGRPLRPGDRLGGVLYEGGELTFQQLLDAIPQSPSRVGRSKRQKGAG